ncbi:adenylate kinase [Sulfurovum sp.]|uniref:adenylate kinase n=1 Tax=Sulfurovum sp. TaxID=1969726 RepID=UPI002867B4EC|nr:adenylate kinase [Sulfurovum sp.]
MPKKLILLIGAPGSGKSTDAKLIAEKHDGKISSYSTGDLIKEEIKKGTGIGSIAKSFVEKGDLVPTQIVVELIVDAVKNAPTEIVMLDGFPGKEKQLKYFCDYIFNNDKINILSVLEIKVNDVLAKERWLASGRSDEIFEHEMISYKESLSEIEAHYNNKHILKVINGERALDLVIADIDTYLESKI